MLVYCATLLALLLSACPSHASEPSQQYPLLHQTLVNDYMHTWITPYTNSEYERKQEEQNLHTMIRDGGKLVYNILSDKTPQYTSQYDYLHDIKNVITFLYASSLHKTQTQNGFSAGAFLIKAHEKLYNFLYQYKEHLNVPKDDQQYFVCATTANTTNNKGTLDEFGYCIATRASRDNECPPDLPARKKGLYVVKDNFNKCDYIRPESKPRTDASVVNNITGGIDSWWRKSGGGTNDIPEFHKPHVPQDIYDQYCNVIDACIKDRRTRETYKQRDGIRIATIINSLDEIQKTLSEKDENHNTIQTLKNTVNQRLDHISFRYGNEIIFGDALLPISYYYYLTHPDNTQKLSQSNKTSITAIQQFATFMHDLYRLRHPKDNERLVNRNTTKWGVNPAITESSPEELYNQMQSLRSMHEKNKNNNHHFHDKRIDAYFDTITQNMKPILDEKDKSKRNNLMLTSPIIDTAQHIYKGSV